MSLQLQRIIADKQLNSVAEIVEFFALPPYYVKVKHHEAHGLLLFMYDQIKTDFRAPGALECRGIILKDTAPFQAVCVPFFKFFNVDEGHAAQIDWPTARVFEKLDGSIIKTYFHNGAWLVATNGTVDSRTTTLHGVDDTKRTFYHLFQDALPPKFDWNALDRDCTYMFELMHPEQLIVVEHDTPRLVHIGTRNNKTLVESYEPLNFVEQARSFALRSRADCLDAASKLGAEQEGFVVVDKNWNRVKIKGAIYVSLHHAGGANFTVQQCAADIFLNGESDEVRAYRLASKRLANVSAEIDRIEERLTNAAQCIFDMLATARNNAIGKENACLTAADRKEMANFASSCYKDNKGAFAVFMQVVSDEIKTQKRCCYTVEQICELIKHKYTGAKRSAAQNNFIEFLDSFSLKPNK